MSLESAPVRVEDQNANLNKKGGTKLAPLSLLQYFVIEDVFQMVAVFL